MPWTPKSAKRHTRRATTSGAQQQWAARANRVLRETGDEGRAVRSANTAIKTRKTVRRRRSP